MQEVKILIIGAGVVGLAIARELSNDTEDVIIVEKNKTFGQETSSRNSEVIHAGMYYPTNSLKAKLCVEGKNLLYEICQKHQIPHKKTGKVIVAREGETADLEELFLQGKNNGVTELRLIEQKELNELEPRIQGVGALYSSQTGIIDSHCLMQYFLDAAKSNGVIIAFNSQVCAIEKSGDGYQVSVKNDNEITALKAEFLINCAGLDSDSIAEMAGIDIKKHHYELYYCKGEYFRVNGNKANFIQRLIYPVPEPKSGGLGIHATLDLGGSLRLGPDDEYLKKRDKDYSVDTTKRTDFYQSAKILMPFLEEADLIPDTAGIRPKLQGPQDDFRDFLIQDEAGNGLPGLINLVGIESPGLTAAPAIAKFVKELIKKKL